ncbi:hypothetical protein, partial [Klebsiella phage vB_KpnM_TU02]
MGKLNIDIVA